MNAEGAKGSRIHPSPLFPNPSSRPLILGTAGHIDHGKTALVRALTGIEADRLPEERRRGMTIDLGFAHMEAGGHKLGIVDVPGHERFIRNMVAGATGIDLVMLVIAADDGVMPQTREHLEIIDLLGVRGGLIALNKVDLASGEELERAKAGITRLVDGTCLQGAPVVEVSAVSGQGVQALAAAIAARLEEMEFAQWPALFRLPIDRRFSLQGHGTIVTGSLIGGDARAGSEAELMPQGRRVRIRSAQSHGTSHEGLDSGRRLAMNLPGVKVSQVQRGNELATPGYLRASRRLAVRLRCLSSAPLTIGAGEWLRLHLGTQDVDARFKLLGPQELEPGQNCLAILQARSEVLATHGQRFIVRSASHGVTVGGGTVLCTSPPRLKLSAGAPAWLAAIESGSPREKLLALLEIEPALGASLPALYRESGVQPDEAEQLLHRLAEEGRIQRSPGSKGSGFWTQAYIDRCKSEILKRLGLELEAAYPRASVERSRLLQKSNALGPPEFTLWLLEQLEAEGEVRTEGARLRRVGHEVKLDPAQEADQARLLAAYERGGFTPPLLQAAARTASLAKEKAEALFTHAVEAGRLMPVSSEIALHASVHERLLDILRGELAGGEGLTVSKIKERLGVSRKYAIPICEYLDRKKFTRRQGDLRFAGERL